MYALFYQENRMHCASRKNHLSDNLADFENQIKYHNY